MPIAGQPPDVYAAVDAALAYGQAKYIGALWIASAARRYPGLRLVTVSPGNTRGTEAAKDLPRPLRLIVKHVRTLVVLPLFGLVHDPGTGAERLVDGLTDPAFRTGVPYASAAKRPTGLVVDQSTIFPNLANRAAQDNADAAVNRFNRPGLAGG